MKKNILGVLLIAMAICLTSCKQEDVMKHDDIDFKTLATTIGQNGEEVVNHFSKIKFTVNENEKVIFAIKKKNKSKIHMFDDEVHISMPYTGNYDITRVEIVCQNNAPYAKWHKDKDFFECVCSSIEELYDNKLQKTESADKIVDYTITESGRTIHLSGLDRLYITIK